MSVLLAGNFSIDLGSPCVMGIVNVTSDSFSGDGTVDRDTALAHARQLIADGARIG